MQRLRSVFQATGPFLTVHAEVGRPTEDGLAQRDARWTTMRHDLEHARVAPDLIGEVGRRLAENQHLPGETRLTLVADAERILFDDVRAGHSHWPEVLDHGDLPDLSGWLGAEDQSLPFLLVVADREGADIEMHQAISAPAGDASSVTGEDFYVTKVAEGDWAQKEFQQTAENTWRANARLVADDVRRLAKAHRPVLTVLAGEVRARAEVGKALHEHEPDVVGIVQQVDAGSRSAGASRDALWDAVTEVVVEQQRIADAELAAELDRVRGQGSGGAFGVQDVLTALGKAQVDQLVIDPAALRDEEVDPHRWSGLPLPAAAADSTDLPADRVLVAAGVLTDARITVLPASMGRGGGASALLRWTEPPTDR